MKTIGLIGGISSESSAEYYKLINTAIRENLGGISSAKIVMNSLNMQEIADLQYQARWQDLDQIIVNAGLSLEKAGADFIVICSNLMHKCAPALIESVSCPVSHIADACAEVMKKENSKKILLLGAIYTMEDGFYQDKLAEHDIEAIIPNEADRKIISEIIYKELCIGQFKPESKQKYLEIINKSKAEGAEAALLACTEIPLLVKNGEAGIPLFETTQIHAMAAVDFALN